MHLNRSGRMLGIAAALAACTVLAACGGSSVVGPTTANNSALLQKFAASMAQADSNGDYARAGEDMTIMQMLSLGAPVNQVTLTIDGQRMGFSAAAGLVVLNDTLGNPTDSAYSFAAWRGANVDTVVMMEYFMSPGIGPNRVGGGTVSASRVFAPFARPLPSGLSASISPVVIFTPYALVLYTAGTSDWQSPSGSATGSFQQTYVGSTCTSFTSPVNLNLPPGVTCLNDKGTASFDATVDSASVTASGSHTVSFAATSVSGARLAITP